MLVDEAPLRSTEVVEAERRPVSSADAGAGSDEICAWRVFRGTLRSGLGTGDTVAELRPQGALKLISGSRARNEVKAWRSWSVQRASMRADTRCGAGPGDWMPKGPLRDMVRFLLEPAG